MMSNEVKLLILPSARSSLASSVQSTASNADPTHPMKLQPDRFDTLAINAYGPGWVAVNGQRFEHSLIVSSQGRLDDWRCEGLASLSAEHFDRLADDQPELVVFGSGSQLRFVPPSLLRGLISKGIGVETMDTMAACRTFNILAGEGRKVVAALIIEPACTTR
jgi:uncharacterized protein